MSTSSYVKGGIVLLSFPFSSDDRATKRPGLVLLDTGDADLVVARVTSQAVRTPFDVVIDHWREAGLLLPSIVRLDKLATLEKRLVERSLGRLSSPDMGKVENVLKLLWQAG